MAECGGTEYSKQYEADAAQTINDIESNHLLAVLIDIPMTECGNQGLPLLQIALEQKRKTFLNNERINAVLRHVWQTPNASDPTVEINRKPMTSWRKLEMLWKSPFAFYLTPMGYSQVTMISHLLYVICIFVFLMGGQHLDDPMGWFEIFLWSLNFGYIVNEIVDVGYKGLRLYFSVAGWVNYWDVFISVIWIIQFSLRAFSTMSHTAEACTQSSWPAIVDFDTFLWAIQAASLSGRFLVFFQSSEYLGVLMTMVQKLAFDLCKFLFVLMVVMVGCAFGLFYIHSLGDGEQQGWTGWWTTFEGLFLLTVGAGDFDNEDIGVAQVYNILFILFAAFLMMNLLVAFMTTTYEQVNSSLKNESSFAFAEITYDLAHQPRFIPAPFGIYVWIVTLIIHCVNFPFAWYWPRDCNVYNIVDHHHFHGLLQFRMTIEGIKGCYKTLSEKGSKFLGTMRVNLQELYQSTRLKAGRVFRKIVTVLQQTGLPIRIIPGDDGTKSDEDEEEKQPENGNRLLTSERVWRYYVSSVCPAFLLSQEHEKKLSRDQFKMHHTGCYAYITVDGDECDHGDSYGITLGQYAEEYENEYKFALDPQDVALVKSLTTNTLFCQHCYRPFEPTNKTNMSTVRLTPFWTLSEILSIYVSVILMIPLLFLFMAQSLWELVCNLLEN